MIVNERFRIATDFLKNSGIVKTHKETARVLDIDEKLFSKYRYGQPYIYNDDEIVQRIISEYPETKQFFTKEYKPPPSDESTVMDEHNVIYPFSVNSALSELVETQKKLISKLETENASLGEHAAKLEAENRALKDILTERGKM